MNIPLILSCEHFGNEVPPMFKQVFHGHEASLDSHRGYDLGAATLYDALIPLATAGFSYPLTRLLIEPNRSLHHPHLFSGYSRTLSKSHKQQLIDEHYLPYRKAVEAACTSAIEQHGSVLHLSVHSFTPVLHGEERNAHVGILYDPGHGDEKVLAAGLSNQIRQSMPHLRVRMNYPYLGKADGLTTHLRKALPDGYNGLELEVRNDLITPAFTEDWHRAIQQWMLGNG